MEASSLNVGLSAGSARQHILMTEYLNGQGQTVGTMQPTIHAWTYTSAAQAGLGGFSSLCPLSSIFRTDVGSSAGYGTLPAMNTSQHVTPNAHWVRNRVSNCSIVSYRCNILPHHFFLRKSHLAGSQVVSICKAGGYYHCHPCSA